MLSKPRFSSIRPETYVKFNQEQRNGFVILHLSGLTSAQAQFAAKIITKYTESTHRSLIRLNL